MILFMKADIAFHIIETLWYILWMLKIKEVSVNVKKCVIIFDYLKLIPTTLIGIVGISIFNSTQMATFRKDEKLLSKKFNEVIQYRFVLFKSIFWAILFIGVMIAILIVKEKMNAQEQRDNNQGLLE